MEADKDGDGRLSFEEFTQMVANTVRANQPHFASNTDYFPLGYRETNDTRGSLLTLSYIYLLGAELLPFSYHTIRVTTRFDTPISLMENIVTIMNKLYKWDHVLSFLLSALNAV